MVMLSYCLMNQKQDGKIWRCVCHENSLFGYIHTFLCLYFNALGQIYLAQILFYLVQPCSDMIHHKYSTNNCHNYLQVVTWFMEVECLSLEGLLSNKPCYPCFFKRNKNKYEKRLLFVFLVLCLYLS